MYCTCISKKAFETELPVPKLIVIYMYLSFVLFFIKSYFSVISNYLIIRHYRNAFKKSPIIWLSGIFATPILFNISKDMVFFFKP